MEVNHREYPNLSGSAAQMRRASASKDELERLFASKLYKEYLVEKNLPVPEYISEVDLSNFRDRHKTKVNNEIQRLIKTSQASTTKITNGVALAEDTMQGNTAVSPTGSPLRQVRRMTSIAAQ